MKDFEIRMFERLMEFESIYSIWKLNHTVDNRWEYSDLLSIRISYETLVKMVRYGIE